MFEIYAYGNVDTLTGVFNAIAAIMGGADYFGLIKAIAITGVLVAAFAGLFTPGKFHGWGWLMGLLPCLAGLRVVECNLSHLRSRKYTDLPKSLRVTDVFQELIRILGPQLVVTFGKEARSYFDPTPDHLGRTIQHVVLGTPVQVFLGNHVIMGGAAFWRDGGYESLRRSAKEVFRR